MHIQQKDQCGQNREQEGDEQLTRLGVLHRAILGKAGATAAAVVEPLVVPAYAPACGLFLRLLSLGWPLSWLLMSLVESSCAAADPAALAL
ncbi:MAG: hypothetical protein ACK4PH_28975, partial [Aquincola tertiaricarbonis]